MIEEQEALWTLHDPKGRLLEMSLAFAEYFGLDRDHEIGGMPPFKWWIGVDPESELRSFLLLVSGELGPFQHHSLRAVLIVHREEPAAEQFQGRFERLDDGNTRFFVLPTGVTGGHGVAALFGTDIADLQEAAKLRRSEYNCGKNYDLSARESVIFEMLRRGVRASDAATRLHLSVHTVRNHRRSVFRKLGVNSQVELMARFGKNHSDHE